MPADQVTPNGYPGVLADLAARFGDARGAVIGTSGPFRVSQPEEDAFAALIGDWDPMHNDPAWRMAAGDGPIVLGFHVLARVEQGLRSCPVIAGLARTVHARTVGLDNVRFPAPFPVGALASAEISISGVSFNEAGLALTTKHRYCVDGASRPVMVAQLLTVVTARDGDDGGRQPGPFPLASSDTAPVLIRELPEGVPVPTSSRHDSAFYDALPRRIGQWLGTTPWTCISDREAHAFALLTGDDGTNGHGDLPSRAHPFLSRGVPPLQLLALRAYFSPLVGLPVLTDESMMAFNYGVDRARWHGAVHTGTRLRDHVQLLGVQARRPGDHLVTTRHILEAEGSDHGALVADCKTLYRTSS
ncbi:MAG TPA: hypothetical protein VMU94_31815 [Streptosporangiaceae bacterium]|nr:hypothetical protein [Streptosporangiaceae bacterium]